MVLRAKDLTNQDQAHVFGEKLLKLLQLTLPFKHLELLLNKNLSKMMASVFEKRLASLAFNYQLIELNSSSFRIISLHVGIVNIYLRN